MAVVGLIGYFAWNSFYGSNRQLNPSAQMPYIHVYGVDQDPATTALRNRLETNNIEYDYKVVLVEKHRIKMLGMLKSLGRETNTDLPVVDVNGYILERPKVEEIMEIYRKYSN